MLCPYLRRRRLPWGAYAVGRRLLIASMRSSLSDQRWAVFHVLPEAVKPRDGLNPGVAAKLLAKPAGAGRKRQEPSPRELKRLEAGRVLLDQTLKLVKHPRPGFPVRRNDQNRGLRREPPPTPSRPSAGSTAREAGAPKRGKQERPGAGSRSAQARKAAARLHAHHCPSSNVASPLRLDPGAVLSQAAICLRLARGSVNPSSRFQVSPDSARPTGS